MDLELGRDLSGKLRWDLRRLELAIGGINFSISNEDNYKAYIDIFDGTQDVVEYIRKANINTRIFDTNDISSERRGTDSFHDFYYFEEALEALEYGTDKYFNSFTKKLKKVDEYIKKYSIQNKIKYKNDVVGFTPIVPNFIKGYPINMISQEKREKLNPTATIIFEKAMSAMHNSDDMISFASIIFSIIQILENKGIRCQVYISSTFANEDEIYTYKIKIKSFTQPLNIYKLQFPVIATDMFRRIGFRLLECCNRLEHRSWESGYGHPLIGSDGYDLNSDGEPTEKLQKLLKIKQDDIFIPNYTHFHYNSSDKIDNTIKKIINGTNLKKYIKLEEE